MRRFLAALSKRRQAHYDHPNFSASHLLKVVDLILAAAKEKGLATRTFDGVSDDLEGAIAQGQGAVDYSALYEETNPEY